MSRITILITLLFLASCKNSDKPDVSNIKVDLTLERFERDFFRIDSNHVAQGLASLRNANPSFYPLYLQDVLGVNPVDSSTYGVIHGLLTSYRPVYDHIEKKYGNLDWLQTELTQAFKYVKYYFPDYKLPQRVTTYLSTFDDQRDITLWQSHLGIALQLYAGKDYPVYQEAPIQAMYPFYISRRFDKEYITANAMKFMAGDIYPDRSAGLPLIEQMVEKGKQWWLARHFLPDAPDSLLTGYTGKQLEWAEDNEGDAWSYVLKNENLYSIDPETIQTYIGESPFTQGMPESSPGNIGQWLGWRIVEKYAKANSSKKIQEILQTPARTVFQEAKYKPR